MMSHSPLPRLIFALIIYFSSTASFSQTNRDCADQYRNTIQQAYIAYYGRPGDPGGVTFWCGKLGDEGGSLDAIIEQFGTSLEFDERYGSLSNNTLIDTVYLQLFGREPDAGGKNFYLNKLESREMSLQTITLDVLNGSMGNDALIIEKKIAIANYFTDKVGNSEFEYDESNIDDIALILLNIDDTTDSFSFATREIDSQFGSVGSSSGAVFYTSNNGQSLSYINFKTNQSKLISDSLPFNSSKIFFSTYGRYVAYEKQRFGSNYMYVNDSVSGNEVQISSVPRNYYWSPEDNFFYSTSSFGSYLGLGSPLDEPIKIVTATPQHITWSKDESKLAVVAEDNHTIYSTTTGEIIISFDITPESAGNDRYITSFTSFSPDGLYLVYGASSGSTQKLYMMEVATGVHKLVASSEYAAFEEVYAWSPSSKYIAIGESNPENTHALNIYHVSSGILEPITDSSVKVMGFEWSPAEDKLAYRVTEQDSFFGKIYIRNVSLPNGSAEVSSHEKVSGFSWSPDSRYLAYYSQMNDSSYSLSLVDSENNSYTTLNDLGPNFNPARELWSASSKYILYSTADETTTNLFVIRSDEAEKIPLDQYTLGTDNHQIKDFRWVPESDTIFYSKRIDKSTSDTESIHTLEIDSFISTSVSNDHSVSFAEKVWLFP